MTCLIISILVYLPSHLYPIPQLSIQLDAKDPHLTMCPSPRPYHNPSWIGCPLPYSSFPVSMPAAVTVTILFLHVVFQFQYKSCMLTTSFSYVWSSIVQSIRCEKRAKCDTLSTLCNVSLSFSFWYLWLQSKRATFCRIYLLFCMLSPFQYPDFHKVWNHHT